MLAGLFAYAAAEAFAQSSKKEQPAMNTNPRLFTFVAGATGAWSIASIKAVVGDVLPAAQKLDIVSGAVPSLPGQAVWALRGVTSNERYVDAAEKKSLVEKQEAFGRAHATHSALIPIRKNAAWWALNQQERRAIFEDRSNHIKTGLKYLPAVSRRLHHCRDLGSSEPFDFLTLFDYTKENASAFEDMVAELRATEEWKFVEREVDVRLVREPL